MPDGEVLLVGGVAAAPIGRWDVVARAGPDVVVLRGDLDDLPDLIRGARFSMSRSLDGKTQVLGDERALDDLDAGAQLVVSAWRGRPLSKPDRPGEGLSWDAPGFEPPGPPTPGR